MARGRRAGDPRDDAGSRVSPRPADPFGLRPATLADVPAMARNVEGGFASHRAWAPPGYRAPTAVGEADRLRERFAWAGWAAHVNADATATPPPSTRLGSRGPRTSSSLFPQPARRGTGVARALLELALADARGRASATMRLLTLAGNARGLAFYAREGFEVADGPFLAPDLGLALLWLRRPL